MEKEDFIQDSDIDILGITKMDTDSKANISNTEPLVESTNQISQAIAAIVNSEAMQNIFGNITRNRNNEQYVP